MFTMKNDRNPTESINPLSSIDTDVTIDELISQRELERLIALGESVLGQPLLLVNFKGEPLTGTLAATIKERTRLPLTLDFEPLAYLEADCTTAQLKPLAQLLEWCFTKQLQYRLASTLHTEIVESDYAELQRQNKALQASEARYKSLSEHLEERVQEQLRTLKNAEHQLHEQERLAAVGQLAAGVAHELNTPLVYITSNLDAAKDYVSQLNSYTQPLLAENPNEEIAFIFEDFPGLISDSLDGCTRSTDIVKSLRDFSVMDSDNETEADLNELIKTVHQLYNVKIPRKMTVEMRLKPLPLFTCNNHHISEVILNILSNSVDALKEMPDNPAPTIAISSSLTDNTIAITIKDNGPGIPEEVLKDIFVPFFTTKAVGQGTGLGLTRCRDIIRAHGGEIKVSSEADQGTLTSITLPTA